MPLDAQCNQAPSYSYAYRSTDPTKQGFQPYDPANPPSDVAQTTTDNGQTLPFVVRVETGYLDRDQYKVAALWQPGKTLDDPSTRSRSSTTRWVITARGELWGRLPHGRRSRT